MLVDFLIVGQGLAGSALALSLRELGASVLVIDREDENSASRVAAGLVTTVAGMGMNPSWRQKQYLPEAISFYQRLEQICGQRFFYPLPILKVFDSQKQQAKFLKKSENIAEWVEEASPELLKEWNAHEGGFMMKHGGFLDTSTYLREIRYLLGNYYQQREFDDNLVHFSDQGVSYNEVNAKAIILCQGAKGLISGKFSFLPHRSAKGEMLLLKINNKPQSHIINRNGWLLPLGDSYYKAGASYEWDDMNGVPTEQGKREVEQKARNLLGDDQPYEVIEHTAGVRPILRKSQPLIGAHPELNKLKFFNGLGSRGVITAPSVANHFAEHLVEDLALDPELDIANFIEKA